MAKSYIWLVTKKGKNGTQTTYAYRNPENVDNRVSLLIEEGVGFEVIRVPLSEWPVKIH